MSLPYAEILLRHFFRPLPAIGQIFPSPVCQHPHHEITFRCECIIYPTYFPSFFSCEVSLTHYWLVGVVAGRAWILAEVLVEKITDRIFSVLPHILILFHPCSPNHGTSLNPLAFASLSSSTPYTSRISWGPSYYKARIRNRLRTLISPHPPSGTSLYLTLLENILHIDAWLADKVYLPACIKCILWVIDNLHVSIYVLYIFNNLQLTV